MSDNAPTPDEVQPRNADASTATTDNTEKSSTSDEKETKHSDAVNTETTASEAKSTDNASNKDSRTVVPDSIQPRQQEQSTTGINSEIPDTESPSNSQATNQDKDKREDSTQTTQSQADESLTPSPEQVSPREERTTQSGSTTEKHSNTDNQPYDNHGEDTADVADADETTRLETGRIRYDIGFFSDKDVGFEDPDGEKWSLREMHQVTDNKSDKAIAAIDVGKRGPLWKIVTKSPDDSIVEYETIEDGIIAVCKQLEYKSSNQTGLSEWSCKTARPEALAYREFITRLYDGDTLNTLAESQDTTDETFVVCQSLVNKTDEYRFQFGKKAPVSDTDDHFIVLQIKSNSRWQTVDILRGNSLVDLLGICMTLIFTGQVDKLVEQSTDSLSDELEERRLSEQGYTEATADNQLNLTDMNADHSPLDESQASSNDTDASTTPDPYADFDLPDTDPVFGDVANSDPADTDNGLAGQNASDSPVDTETETEADEQKSDIDFTEFDYDWTRDTNVSFSDVGGMEKLKSKIYRDVIEPFTTKRKQAKKLGIPVPNVLFYGPPGTGKTYFAQAIASELGLPFVKLSGGDITSKWINASTGKVATLFTEATTVADAYNGAVIFLDEIDSVLKDRSSNSHEEDHKVVNEFLNRLEDISNIESDILFIGATNRYDRLDTAGVRTGRIDKEIEIGKPDQEAREAVFAAQLNDRPHNLTADMIRQAASYTDGYVPADIEGIVTDAARRALHAGDGFIQPENLEDAIVDASPSVASDPD